MIRWLYIALLRMHPARFRQRFGDEMLWIFDASHADGRTASIFFDGVRSLCRQWMHRPQAQVARASVAAPAFYICDGDTPRRSALLQGLIGAMLIFWALSYVLTHGGSRGVFSSFVIGSHNHSFSHLLPVRSRNAAASEPDTLVKVKPEPVPHKIPAYFRMMPVLTALDTDEDGVISAVEIANAPFALKALDLNRDGKLSAEECGLQVKADPQTVERARRGFMRLHPVLAALDANHDGAIDAREIGNAAVVLRALDENRDGRLTVEELLPDRAVNLATMLMFALDRNGDGLISKPERDTPFGRRFGSLLSLADRDGDGLVSERELTNEIRFRATLYKDGVMDLRRLEDSFR